MCNIAYAHSELPAKVGIIDHRRALIAVYKEQQQQLKPANSSIAAMVSWLIGHIGRQHLHLAMSCGEQCDKAKKFAFTRLSPT